MATRNPGALSSAFFRLPPTAKRLHNPLCKHQNENVLKSLKFVLTIIPSLCFRNPCPQKCVCYYRCHEIWQGTAIAGIFQGVSSRFSEKNCYYYFCSLVGESPPEKAFGSPIEGHKIMTIILHNQRSNASWSCVLPWHATAEKQLTSPYIESVKKLFGGRVPTYKQEIVAKTQHAGQLQPVQEQSC